MHLKSLTLRGFKSFASSTTLELEPGITCVVGPNGSGKSNVVDALSWVMGEQGAKTLRGGKMEDVIFAGTAGRPPLGRAEVVLTIDNSDGALPIEYSEVTISRTMFRNGGSEYAINGTTCRLLDVQELLSDSGIGREMHVIVGQGQLDSILRATPEERRGFIEEAAGVLKHRKRKEKALRKLDATEANLTRLGDVLNELRRQLKPLGRQAEVARRAVGIQADVRDARARLLADDIAQAQRVIATELADETALRQRRAAAERAVADARAREAELEEALAADSPRLAVAQEAWYALSSLRERLRGTTSLATERVRRADAEQLELPAGRDPEQLEAEAARAEAQLAGLQDSVSTASAALAVAVSDREQAETRYREEETRVAAVLRAASDQREGLARLHGQVSALRSRAAAADDELARLNASRSEALQKADDAQREFTALESRIAGLEGGETGLDTEFERAEARLAELDAGLEKLVERTRQAERAHAGLVARIEALKVGLAAKDGAGALLAVSEQISGLLGSVAALVQVEPGFEVAVASALGSAADAVAVDRLDTAVGALERLRAEELGRAGLMFGPPASASGVDDPPWPALPDGATYAVDVVEAPDALAGSLRRLLVKVAVVDDLAAARTLVGAFPELTAVTRDGDLLGSHFARGGSASAASLIEVRAAVDAAGVELGDVEHQLERLRFDRERAENDRRAAAGAAESLLERLHESDAQMSAVADQLGRLGSAARAARAVADQLAEAIAEAEAAHERDLSGLAELEARLLAAQEAPDAEPDSSELEARAEAATAARRAETDARLELRTNEERARALREQVEAMRSAAALERESRLRAIERRERQRREASLARVVLTAAGVVADRLEWSIELAAAERSAVERARTGREAELRDVRAGLRAVTDELDGLTDSVHKDEIARAELRLRMEALAAKASDELGLDVEQLLADYGPDVPIAQPDRTDESGAAAAPIPFVRAEQAKRLRLAERELALLGRVNPLALEEFAALEERHQFLSDQIGDLRKTRQSLLDIVDDVDAQVQRVFAEAWEDTRREFEDVFCRLFPGGEGRLVLTDPDNLLLTGVDVEARPPGKKVKRLSLLSGGERSLVAVAFLVALFKARPSPFYILDEVEAALDDTNLGRLLEIYEELRDTSQLVVITHQKRTMEVADALYGVSMRGDGVSAVISQRLREAESA